MKSKKFRIYEMDGKQYEFNFACFEQIFKGLAECKKIKIGELEEKAAKEICVSSATVHNWRFQCNAPDSIEIVKKIAKVLGIKDYMLFLSKISEEEDVKNMVNSLNARQLEAVKSIYDSIIDFLEEFEYSDGFNGYWQIFKDQGIEDTEIESAIYDYVEERQKIIFSVYKKEYFDLHNTSVYDELGEYIYGNLYDIYDGKLSYAYRFEAISENHPTTRDDYGWALRTVNEIIEKYN